MCHVPASHSGRHEQRLLVGVLGDGARAVDEGDAGGLFEHRRGQGGIRRRATGGGRRGGGIPFQGVVIGVGRGRGNLNLCRGG